MFQIIFNVATIVSAIYAATIYSVYMYIITGISILSIILFSSIWKMGRVVDDARMILLLGVLGFICRASWFITIPVIFKNIAG